MAENIGKIIEKAKEVYERLERTSFHKIPKKNLSRMIDHTLLKPEAKESDIKRLLQEAIENRFWGICIPQVYLPIVSQDAKKSGVKLITVVGFPLGYVSPEIKARETAWSAERGADEIDMVIHVGKAKDQKFGELEKEIKKVVEAAGDKLVKVILETALLTDEEKVLSALAAKKAGAHFVKTSTGFGPGGATLWDVVLLRTAVGEKMGVKAAGGIRTYKDACKMIQAGATRLGTSRSLKIVSEATEAR